MRRSKDKEWKRVARLEGGAALRARKRKGPEKTGFRGRVGINIWGKKSVFRKTMSATRVRSQRERNRGVASEKNLLNKSTEKLLTEEKRSRSDWKGD